MQYDDVDSSDEEMFGKRNGKRKRRARKGVDDADDEDIVMDEGDGNVMDLGGASALGRVKKGNTEQKDKEFFKIAEDGRIVIPFDDEKEDDNENDSVADSDDGMLGRNDKRSCRKRKNNDEDLEEQIVQSSTRALNSKTKVIKSDGTEFKAKKSSGDIKKNGAKFEPYAYIPLDHKLLNKRRKHESARAWKGVNFKGPQKEKRQFGRGDRKAPSGKR
jgi:ribosomal RNA-processing protein 12